MTTEEKKQHIGQLLEQGMTPSEISKTYGYNTGTIYNFFYLAKGGLHSWDNVKLAHRVCNSSKGAR